MRNDADGDRETLAIHATAVAIDGHAVLIRGPSKAGKSTLALDLLAHATLARPVVLIGDDRVLLWRDRAGLVVAPHPRIAGMIEKRGVGILSVPFLASAPVAAMVDLPLAMRGRSGPQPTCDLMGENFPCLVFVNEDDRTTRGGLVLAWLAATSAAHRLEKAHARSSGCAKD